MRKAILSEFQIFPSIENSAVSSSNGNFLNPKQHVLKGEIVYVGRRDYSKSDGVLFSVLQSVLYEGVVKHSCEPNAKCLRNVSSIGEGEHRLCYYAVATRDISAGAEITFDFATVDYNCKDFQIENCSCGSIHCRRMIKSFKNLSLEMKINLLPHTDDEVRDNFLLDNPRVQIVNSDNNYPEGVVVDIANRTDMCLRATKSFAVDEVVFHNKMTILPKVVGEPVPIFLWKFPDFYRCLDSHMIQREKYYEFYGFDSFMNHSCDANVWHRYDSKDEYTIYARKPITAGDELTCDYETLEDVNAGVPKEVFSTSMTCNCGAENCRGIIPF
eukprot:gene24576-33040_t